MGSVTQDYSGIVINQNAVPRVQFDWLGNDGEEIFQDFLLPVDYQRGTDTVEQRYPDLSGLQILVSIAQGYAFTATINYELQWLDGPTWETVAQGTTIGAQADGEEVWFDLIFDNSIPIQANMPSAQWRLIISIPTTTGQPIQQPVFVSNGQLAIGSEVYVAALKDSVPFPITVNDLPAFFFMQNNTVTWSYQEGITDVLAVQTSPLPIQGTAVTEDGTDILSSPSCLNFRLLSLQADSGTDFLGNGYRSSVITRASDNVQTTLGSSPTSGASQSPYWMSQILPSPSSVEALYFDLRSVPSGTVFGSLNFIKNPSFEYDPVNDSVVAWWVFNDVDSIGAGAIEVTDEWAASGDQSLKITIGSGIGVYQLISPVTPLAAITQSNLVPNLWFAAVTNVVDNISTSEFNMEISFFDANQVLLQNTTIAAIGDGIATTGGFVNVPTSTAFVQFIFTVTATSGTDLEFYIDAIEAVIVDPDDPDTTYFDGDTPDCLWEGQAGISVSATEVDQTVQDDFIVVDGILVDPVTPNMYANVYYTLDDTGNAANMTQTEWDSKLWSRVPQVFPITGRKQFVFPNPVHAKYIKVEFTNPQSQSYNPGDFQTPTAYQQFPNWVKGYFFALNAANTPTTSASTVSVQYDALSLAYIPYLGDLVQSPDNPIAIPSSIQINPPSWNPNTNTQVDSNTLGQINLTLNQFTNPLGSSVTIGSLGMAVNNLVGSADSPTTVQESDPSTITSPPITTVSSLNRDAVLQEQTAPPMYFYLTCRHTYQTSIANFDFNRGYVFGVNEIAFMRNNYGVASDMSMYVETSGDTTNIQKSDFTLGSDNNWYVYDAS